MKNVSRFPYAGPASLFVFCLFGLLAFWSAGYAGKSREPLVIGSERQLFVDHYVIGKLDGVSLRLHQPHHEEVAIPIDRPYESGGVSYAMVMRDGDVFRMYYRAIEDKGYEDSRIFTAYAESEDGVHWKKPDLGIIDFGGSKRNNLIWEKPGKNMAVIKDPNEGIPKAERYKAVVRSVNREERTDALLALVSADGIHWNLARKKPILTRSPFDTMSVLFWDSRLGKYVIYTRAVRVEGRAGLNMGRSFGYGLPEGHPKGMRWVRRATSDDFYNWSDWEDIQTGDAPLEHFYTNATTPYLRAPQIYLMFPSRFVDTREPIPGWKYGPGVNDVVLLSSRDGVHFSRTFMEAFIRPGRDSDNWHERSVYMEHGILQTSRDELSFYGMESWRLDSNRIRRYSLRVDGFVSVNAPYDGGEVVTKPLRFTGDALYINYATSAVGKVEVELRDRWSNPLEGFTFAESPEIYGDEIDRQVEWSGSLGLSSLEGQAVRLAFRMHDADLYAFQFRRGNE